MTGDGTIVTGRRVADRYRLVAPRRDGGWDAVDETLRRSVVVQLLPPDADDSAKAHFTAEARALAGLPHRNVVATYDTGTDSDGSVYRVDELPQGTPLDPASVPDTLRVSFATQIARAVAEAHARGLVHGSLTSGSVLVHEEARVKVCGLHLPESAATDEMCRTDVDAMVNLVAALAPAGAHPLRDLASGWRGADPPHSISDVVNALVALPDDADTVALVDPRPTPVGAVPARRPRRFPLALAVSLVVLVAVALVVTALLPGKGGPGDVSGPVRALPVVASSFDPEATPPKENEAQAPLAVDGNPATAWRTERYRSAHFGNLKDGVGLVLRTQDQLAEFQTLRIRTSQTGWTYELYVADAPAARLAGWGKAIASGRASSRDFTVQLGGVKGGALLVWITEPGPTHQTRIEELDVSGRV